MCFRALRKRIYAVGLWLIALCLHAPSAWGMGQIRARVHLAGMLAPSQTPTRRALVPLLQRRGFAMAAGASSPDVIRIQLQADGRLALQNNALSKIYKIPSGIQDADVRARAIMLFLGLFCDENKAQQPSPSAAKRSGSRKPLRRNGRKVAFVRANTTAKKARASRRTAPKARRQTRKLRRSDRPKGDARSRPPRRKRSAPRRLRPRSVAPAVSQRLRTGRGFRSVGQRRPSAGRGGVLERTPGAPSDTTKAGGRKVRPLSPGAGRSPAKSAGRPAPKPSVKSARSAATPTGRSSPKPTAKVRKRPPARAAQPARRPVVPRALDRPVPRSVPRARPMKMSDITKKIAAGRRLLGRDTPPVVRSIVDDRAAAPVARPSARRPAPRATPSQPRTRRRVALARPLPSAVVRRRPPAPRPVTRIVVRRVGARPTPRRSKTRVLPRRSRPRPARRVAMGIKRGVTPRPKEIPRAWWLAMDLAGAFSPVGVEGLPVGGSLALIGGWKWISLKLDVGLLNVLSQPPFRAWMLRPTLSLEFVPVRLSAFWLSLGVGGGAEIYWGDDNRAGRVMPRLVGKLSITVAWRPLRWLSVFASAEGLFSPQNLSFKGLFQESLFETRHALLHLSVGLRFSFW